MKEAEAIDIAEKVIEEDFPDMADAERKVDKYTSDGIEFYELTYSKDIAVDVEGESLEIPQIVVVTIDTETGEEYVAVSN